jgi:DNA primase
MIPDSESDRIRRERSVLEFMPNPKRSGRAFVSLCPLPGHDEKTASFYVYADGGYKCYGCGRGGKDVIAFGFHYWDLSWPKDFPLVMERLGARTAASGRTFRPPTMTRGLARPDVVPMLPDAASRAIYAAAADVWQANLWKPTGRDALAYLRGRGLPDDLIRRERLGLATGTLASALHRRGLSLDLARALGVLRADGQETFTGRVVWCEWRRIGGAWQPVWATARLYGPGAAWESTPKYLNTRGDRVLGGLDRALGAPVVAVVEGSFDRLALLSFGEPAVFLGSNDPPEPVLCELRRLATRAVLYLVRDQDRAGRRGAWATLYKLNLPPAARVVLVDLPRGVKDAGELAERPDGAQLYGQAKRRGRVIDSARLRRLCDRCHALVQRRRAQRRIASAAG